MSHRPSAKQERAKQFRKRWIISLSVVLVLLLALGSVAAYAWSQYGERIALELGWTSNDFEGNGQGEIVITISSGEIGEDVARTLADAGVVKTSQAFYELLLAQDPAVDFHPGSYRLRLEMSSQAALDALQDPENRVRLTAMIPEGRTASQTLELISDGAEIPLDDLIAAASEPRSFGLPEGVDSLEGWLHPATYEFEPETSAHDAIAKLVGYQVSMLDDLGVPEADRQRVRTEASIVQREAGTADDFGKVARVIENRLAIGMKLEMDSTSQYGIGQDNDGSVWSSGEALGDDNPWNTYLHEGLPVGPIANPGRAAVEATLNPTPGDWLYFVAINLETGESRFNETYAGHEADTQVLREWCAENPGFGC
ncbi:MAG: endolytic transglycosylase MltG [Microbacteriaceae bacterium]|nr:endolytic transglycosylase MltG [Microbacteriaceae bacterium]